MRRLSFGGLQARLALALVGIAVLAVSLATVLANWGLDPLVDDAARARVQRSSQHMAEIVAAVYREEGGWSPQAQETVRHLAELDGLRVNVRIDGVGPGSDVPDAGTTAPVLIDGEPVGSVEVAQAVPGLLTPEEEHLGHALDRLHVAAGAVSVIAALILAYFLAKTLSQPLRRIRVAAESIGQGNLGARVDPIGGPEMRAVGLALNRLAETLEREEEIRKHTVADLAHELRTPVNGILARIEAAQDGVLAGPANLAAMHTEALRLTRLLDDLSRLTDAEQPGILLKKHPVDLSEVARAVANSFAPRFTDAVVLLEVVAQPVWVAGNVGRLEQVVSNLLSNALRYTDKGGSVSLRTRRERGDAILDITDTGVGIAPDDLPNLFTRFWRGDPSRSPSTGGTGIGLAIVRELVRAHDGQIQVTSTLNVGTQFRIVLPAVQPTANCEA